MEDEINILDYLNIIRKQWKIIAITVAIALICTLVINVFEKSKYETSANIIIRGGGGVAGAAQILGINFGSSSLGEMSELLKSRAVTSSVLEELVNSRMIAKKVEEGLDLKNGTGKMTSKINGSFLEIKVESRDAKAAADMANAYVESLKDYWNKLNLSESRKKREYLEAQIPIVAKELKNAEDDLKSLTYMSGPHSASGAGGIEIARLQREVEIQSSVYMMLRKEYESAKLDEAKEISPFSDVENAEIPQKPVNSNKLKKLLLGGIIGLFLGIFFAFLKDYIEQSRKNPGLK